jgi:nicotinamidase-related amidase
MMAATNTSSKSALLIIDLQKDLCHDDRRRHLVQEALPHILELIKLFRRSDRPIYFTRFELEPDDPQFERFGDRYCVRGTPGAEFIDEIRPLDGEVVAKKKHSAFFETDLADRLAADGCDGVVLAGLQTQICILTTAADAYHRGLKVVIASDCVVSTRDDVRLEALDWIAKYVGEVQSAAEIVQAL